MGCQLEDGVVFSLSGGERAKRERVLSFGMKGDGELDGSNVTNNPESKLSSKREFDFLF